MGFANVATFSCCVPACARASSRSASSFRSRQIIRLLTFRGLVLVIAHRTMRGHLSAAAHGGDNIPLPCSSTASLVYAAIATLVIAAPRAAPVSSRPIGRLCALRRGGARGLGKSRFAAPVVAQVSSLLRLLSGVCLRAASTYDRQRAPHARTRSSPQALRLAKQSACRTVLS